MIKIIRLVIMLFLLALFTVPNISLAGTYGSCTYNKSLYSNNRCPTPKKKSSGTGIITTTDETSPTSEVSASPNLIAENPISTTAPAEEDNNKFNLILYSALALLICALLVLYIFYRRLRKNDAQVANA